MSFYDSLPNNLFRRCVTGCPNETPACPTCADDEICSLVAPTCEACQMTVCVPSPAAATTVSSSSNSSSSGSNVGAIAGGVIGGIAAIAIVTYLVWRFCVRNKRHQYAREEWSDNRGEPTEAEKEFNMRRDQRASTHTVASIASTVLTRASNIIQIAYIPGVTNRSAPSTPGLLVPPVPPIPIALSSAASTPRYEQEHFFMPGDLRDSTYSGISDRTSYARNSVASTIYGKNAFVSPVPAQTMVRGKAAVVSVKSNGVGTPPPVPSVDYGKYGIGGPPSPAFSVGSTFLNSASAATQVRPQLVRIESGSQNIENVTTSEDSAKATQSRLPRDSSAITIIDDTPHVEQGPFSDPPQSGSRSSLSAVIDEAQERARRTSEGMNTTTPFGDEHEVKN